MIIDATVLVVSQVGKLVKNFDSNFQKQYSNIRWRAIKNLRNKIVHDYEGIQINLIWSIVKEDLPQLKSDLQKITSS